MLFKLPIYLIRFSFTWVFIFYLINVQAQEERGFLNIKGQSFYNKEVLQEVKVTVYRNQKVFTKTKSDKNGKFNLQLEFFSDYKIVFEKESFFTVFIEVDSRLPADLLPMWATYAIKIPFFKLTDTEVNTDTFDKPIAAVSFDKERKKFTDLNNEKFLRKQMPKTIHAISNENKLPEKKEIVTPHERAEEQHIEALKNLAEKNKKETELLVKVKNKKQPQKTTSDIKTTYPATQGVSEREEQLKEEQRITQAQKSAQINSLFVNRYQNDKSTAQYKTNVKQDKGIFSSKETITVLKNEQAFFEFVRNTPFWGEEEFFINQKKVLSTEYFLKLKQFIK